MLPDWPHDNGCRFMMYRSISLPSGDHPEIVHKNSIPIHQVGNQ